MQKKKNLALIDTKANVILATIAILSFIIAVSSLGFSFYEFHRTIDIAKQANDISRQLLEIQDQSRFADLYIYFGGLGDKAVAFSYDAFMAPFTYNENRWPKWEIGVINVGGSPTGPINLYIINNWTERSGSSYIQDVIPRNMKFIDIEILPNGLNGKNYKTYNYSQIPVGFQNLTFSISPCVLCNKRSRIINVPICIYENYTTKEQQCPGL